MMAGQEFKHQPAGVHQPVMLSEVLDALRPKDGDIHLDATFGAGGYSAGILNAAKTTVYAIDRDPEAHRRGSALVAHYQSRLHLLSGCFGDMEALLKNVGITHLDGIVLDLGVSSPQIDNPERGFSFRFDGPLDMRMSLSGVSAADIVNHWSEEDLVRIIRDYGEERFSRRIARSIVCERRNTPINTTSHLAALVRSCIPKGSGGKDKIDPATRTFQALRIQVNDELGELDRALAASERLLSPGGRLVVVAFHSLEDRRVKTFFRTRSGKASRGSRHLPSNLDVPPDASFNLIKTGVLKPGRNEESINPRSRSARLRAATRTGAPIRGHQEGA